jgi:hypothetical protein
MIQDIDIQNKCILTRDSIYFKGEQSRAFQILYAVVLGSFLIAALFDPIYLIGVLAIALMFRDPFDIEVSIQRGIGKQYLFHFSIPFGSFTLFCLNGRFFGLSGELADNVKTKLTKFKELHN